MYPLHRVSSLLSPEQLHSSIVLSQALAELKQTSPKEKADGDNPNIVEAAPEREDDEVALAMDTSNQDETETTEKQIENVSEYKYVTIPGSSSLSSFVSDCVM